MSKRWQKVEIAYLKKNATKRTLQELAERFHTEPSVVEAKLRELKLASGQVPDPSDEQQAAQFQKAMKSLYAEKWAAAGKVFEAMAADGSSPGLAARARQYADLCQRRQAATDASDPFLQAVVLKNDGQLDEALAACKTGRRKDKDDRFAYLAAVICCQQGDLDAAAGFLAKAIELDRRNLGQARRDADLDELRQDPARSELFEA